MKNNKALIFIIFLLIIPFSVLAATVPANTDPNMVCSDLKNSFYSEEIKTRSDLKSYFDFKSDALITTVSEKSQAFLDENFQALDNRIHQYLQMAIIKLAVAIVASVLMAHMIYFLIINAVNKLRRERNRIEAENRKKEF